MKLVAVTSVAFSGPLEQPALELALASELDSVSVLVLELGSVLELELTLVSVLA